MTQPPENPPPYGQQPVPPYGAQPPPPPYGQQPYAQQPYYGQPYYGQQPYYEQPQKTGTNGFAIAGLIFGIIPICFIGVVFSIIALVQIGKSGQKGKGLAIAGLVLSGLWMIGFVTAGVIGALEEADRDGSGVVTDGGKVLAGDLEVGDCVADLPHGDAVFRVSVVPCTQAHEGEVFASIHVTGPEFPGIDRLSDQANRECFDELEADAPEAYKDETVGVFFLHPTARSWPLGDREITCVATYEEKRTGHLQD